MIVHNMLEPELVITQVSPSELKADEENKVVLFIQDKQAQLGVVIKGE